MRFCDAPHIRPNPLQFERSGAAGSYQLLGLLGLLATWILVKRGAQAEAGLLWLILAGMLGAWLLAWWQQVGAAWRSTLVATALLAATHLTWLRLAGGGP